METIKVNMNPNPLDVQTIHASQNDTEARQWEFELHNNGELIDTSDVTDQITFKSYEGGTEQILPENGSVPTTSPFLGDIKYPQGLLSDQEFLYRESPTEEDGLAKITDIKGNTLNWNQQLRALSSTYWAVTSQTSGSFADGVGTFTSTGTTFGCYVRTDYRFTKTGHKYLFSVEVTSSRSGNVNFGLQNVPSQQNVVSNTKTRLQSIAEATTDNANVICYKTQATEGDTFVVSNFFAIDLTQMGLDSITDPSDFTSLFSLPYYAYNQGELISFNGEQIKTVGKNLIDPSIIEYGKNWSGDANASRANYSMRMPYGQYTFSIQSIGTLAEVSVSVTSEKYGERSSLGGLTNSAKRRTVTVDANHPYVQFLLRVGSGTVTQADFESCSLMLESGSVTSEYEPYTSTTTNLPISTYFPTGMKSAGTVYDELTESKAITRVGQITFDGTQTMVETFLISTQCRVLYSVPNIMPRTMETSVIDDGVISNYLMPSSNEQTWNGGAGIHRRANGAKQIMVSLGTASGITTVEAWNAYLSAHPLTVYYPLESPTETSFTTASLVTENAEIPLSNEDGVLVGKCTDELSSQPGFIDAKIKLTDGDGTCYSNKIQLHVERKPS